MTNAKNYTPIKSCHAGPVKVFHYNANGASIWAGGYNEKILHPRPFALRVALGSFNFDNFTPDDVGEVKFCNTSAVISEDMQSELTRNWAREAVLGVDWRDMSVPKLLDRAWFTAFNSLVGSLPADSEVYVHCHGGHGRTGTFLAILAYLNGACPPGECPVTWLRLRYCAEAVETDAQLNYIDKLLGIFCLAKSAKPYQSYSGPYKPSSTYGGGADLGTLPFQEITGSALSSTSTDAWGDAETGKETPTSGEAPAPGGTARKLTTDEVRDWYAGDAWIRAEVSELIERESSSNTSWQIAAWMAARKRVRDIGSAPYEVREVPFVIWRSFTNTDVNAWDAPNWVKNWWAKSRAEWEASHERFKAGKSPRSTLLTPPISDVLP